ncbi:MAG: hypothetical protein NTX36_02255 [Proteobacteria bacterium]|nr:hypothetical protein [Pseudomonadota bacterium]
MKLSVVADVEIYLAPFRFYCEISIVDADRFVAERSLEKAVVYPCIIQPVIAANSR